MKLGLLTIAFLVWCSPALVRAQNCGRATKDRPVTPSTSEQSYLGNVSSLSGRVSYPNDTAAEYVIVELYLDTRADPDKRMGYLEVNEVTKSERIAARHIESGGRFCFKNMKPGRYMLRVGMLHDTQWAIQSVFITLVPPGTKSARKSLQVILYHAI